MNEIFKIKSFKTLSSTNLYSKENIGELCHYDVILAESQTNGIGRMGREWISFEEKNLYFSIILKSNLNRSISQNITQIIAVATCNVLSEYNLHPFIKWPNDVMVNGKKISGILCENIFKDNVIKAMILGVGINVNMSADSLKIISQPATSIKNEILHNVETKNVLNKFLFYFNELYTSLTLNGFNEIYNEWKKLLTFRSNFIQVQDGRTTFRCEIIDINTDGSLRVKVENEFRNIYSGDILNYDN